MTQILKKQLTMMCGAAFLGGALLWQNGALRAQSYDNPARAGLGSRTARVKLTRDEAARGFVALLRFLSDEERRYSPYGSSYGIEGPEEARLMSSFSTKSERDLGDIMELVLLKMAQQWKEPQLSVAVQSESAQTATVTVQNETPARPRPLILEKENDSWGVDVAATYAAWNGTGAEGAAAMDQLKREFGRARDNARRSSCQSNLKQIALGIAQYVQDYDEKFPPAKPWIDVLQPYVRSEQIFKCPSVTDAKGYGYALNAKLSGKSLMAVESSAETVSVYETSVLKRNAYGLGENRAFRHMDGANYAFTDGHVKWFDQSKTPALISNRNFFGKRG